MDFLIFKLPRVGMKWIQDFPWTSDPLVGWFLSDLHQKLNSYRAVTLGNQYLGSTHILQVHRPVSKSVGIEKIDQRWWPTGFGLNCLRGCRWDPDLRQGHKSSTYFLTHLLPASFLNNTLATTLDSGNNRNSLLAKEDPLKRHKKRDSNSQPWRIAWEQQVQGSGRFGWILNLQYQSWEVGNLLDIYFKG